MRKKFDPSSIVSSKSNPYGIPAALRKYIKNKYGWKRFTEFRDWYGKSIRSEQTKGAKVYEAFSEALEGTGSIDAQIKGKKRYSANRSHIQSHVLGGSGYTFLEYWVNNQARAASEKAGKPFINPEVLREAGLPTNWVEFFHAWDQQTQGNYTSLGSLNDINPDDLIALHRGDPLEKVFQRRELLNNYVETAVNDPTTITENQQAYSELFAKSRGLNPYDTKEISLRQHSGWVLGPDGNYIRKEEEEAEADYFARETTRFAEPGEVDYIAQDYSDDEIGIDPSELQIRAPKHKWFQNPLGGMPKPTYDSVYRKENKSIKDLQNYAAEGLAKTLLKIPSNTPPLTNTLGIKTDQSLGLELENQQRLLNQAYQERINPNNPNTAEQLLEQYFTDDE